MNQEQEPKDSLEQTKWKAPKFKNSLIINPQFKAAIKAQEQRQAAADEIRANEVRRSIGLPVAEASVSQSPADKFSNEVTAVIELNDEVQFQARAKQLVAARLAELSTAKLQHKEIDPAAINANKEKLKLNGFIGPETRVKRSSVTEGFFMDDQRPYEGLIGTLRELKIQSPDQSTRGLLTQGVYREVNKYFGNWTGGSQVESANQSFYFNEQDKTQADPKYRTSIGQLHRKNIATCGEKAALAQNLFLLSGMQSNLVFGKIGNEDHAYNIIDTEKGKFIVDVTNPVVSTKDGQITNYGPSIYPISQEQLAGLDTGQPIEVSHVDYEIDQNNQYIPRETKLTYS